MYCAKQRASLPFVMGSPATSHVGREIVAGSPASFASAAIAEGFMSGLPTICSCFRLVPTVERPPKPMTIAPIPNATRMIPAA